MRRIVVLAAIVLVGVAVATFLFNSSQNKSAPSRDLLEEKFAIARKELKEIEAKISESLRTGPDNPDLTGHFTFLRPIPESVLPLIRPGADKMPVDPFRPETTYQMHGRYSGEWFIYSVGPDNVQSIGSSKYETGPSGLSHRKPMPDQLLRDFTYNPTNGRLSSGDIWVRGTVPLKNPPPPLYHSNQ